MNTSTTPSAAVADPTCSRCRDRGWTYMDAGWGHFPHEVDCPDCADQGDDEDDEDDAARWNDDVAESCPDDSSRFAAIASRFHPGHAA